MSDICESLLGAHLIHNGHVQADRFLNWVRTWIAHPISHLIAPLLLFSVITRLFQPFLAYAEVRASSHSLIPRLLCCPPQLGLPTACGPKCAGLKARDPEEKRFRHKWAVQQRDCHCWCVLINEDGLGGVRWAFSRRSSLRR